MMLQRHCLTDFESWYSDKSNRKPLLIRGARQIGKTTAVRLFAKEQGLELIECNMEKPWNFKSILQNKNPQKIIESIEFEIDRDIDADNSILFFDEVQGSPELIPVLRYFYEEAPQYAVICTGSLIEFVLAEPTFSMPVGRVELYHMQPFSFEEYLLAMGHRKAFEFLQNYSFPDKIPDAIHQKLHSLVKEFIIVGGMPEAMLAYKETNKLRTVEKIKSTLIETFILDFNKYQPKANTVLLRSCFESLPLMMGKKLIYTKLDTEHKSRDIAPVVQQLKLAGVICKVFRTAANGIPLAAEKDDRFFKVISLDSGLLLTQLGLNPGSIESTNDINLVNQGVLSEQFIGQQLCGLIESYREPELFYWARQEASSSAEVDYVITDHQGTIVPVEVKSGKTGSLKSLQLMIKEKQLNYAVRFNADTPNLLSGDRGTVWGDVQFKLLSIPHYLVGQTQRILEEMK